MMASLMRWKSSLAKRSINSVILVFLAPSSQPGPSDWQATPHLSILVEYS